ncbi:adenosine deaminase [Demequina aurantiaca]|uniref:adenosine deaminase n=1 Tax=Demequina aurantiaca TaxID=676200 RepID=UPI003D32C8A4
MQPLIIDDATFAREIPKAELHLHIDGTLEPELKLVIAERNGIKLEQTTADEIRETYKFHDLESFLNVHYPNMDVLWTEQDYFDLCSAYLRRAAAQGVRHVEIFFDPQLHTSRGVPFSTFVSGYRRAIITAEREFGIHAALVMCFLRDHGVKYAMATLMESLPYKEWILGVGLDSNEQDHPPIDFKDVMARARAEGYMVTVHCDIDQVNSIEHIRQALMELEVDRIDHGTNIVEDDELLEIAISRGIGFTTCPLSNSQVNPGMKAGEIVAMLDRGALISVNSDDPPYFGGYVGDNYVALQEYAGLDRDQVVKIARNSFLSSWLPTHLRDSYVAELEAWVAERTPAATSAEEAL